MIFDYKCANCGHVFEKVVGIDVEFIDCLYCKGKAQKQFHATSNVFIPAYFHTSRSDIFNYQEWQDLKKNPDIERAK